MDLQLDVIALEQLHELLVQINFPYLEIPWLNCESPKAKLFIQSDRRLIAGDNTQLDLFNPLQAKSISQHMPEQLLANALTAIGWIHIHLHDFTPMTCPLASHANEPGKPDEPFTIESAKHYVIW